MGTEHSATIPSGTYKDNIGKTTFNIVCNDSEGYSIYAVGYSGSEFGNNKLLANINGTFVSSANINTGTNTSGNPSSWSMKLTPSTGLNASNILNGYNNYNNVPNQYVKVTSLVPATNPSTNNTTSLEATYAANISSTQPAGTYEGKVKYTMVHPATYIPNEPKDCAANRICYWPNGNGTVVDSMGDRFVSATSTSETLWASNFKRTGYGFAGWSDKYDWVLNQNDENGNGTGHNEGYHIYGPNQTITIAAGQYADEGLSLYAVWAKPQGAIQNWNKCSIMNTGEVTALRDLRDNNIYAVAKLKDGECWMIENLRLDNTANITALNTDNPNPTFRLGVSDSSVWCENNTCSIEYMNMPRYYSGNTTNPVSNMTATGGNIYSYGNYYSAYTANAGSKTVQEVGKAPGSICPIGWHLPHTAWVNQSNEEKLIPGGFYYLNYKLNNNVNITTAVASANFRSYPNNFLFSGYVFREPAQQRGQNGEYYGDYSAGQLNQGVFRLYPSSVVVLEYSISTDAYQGRTIRCVARD